ncbi:MAG: class I SAM-dependent methyltransferase [Gammaproteobacteria bacterium]
MLDYGCGYGRVTRLLTSMGYEAVLGYDISEAMLARGRRTRRPIGG